MVTLLWIDMLDYHMTRFTEYQFHHSLRTCEYRRNCGRYA